MSKLKEILLKKQERKSRLQSCLDRIVPRLKNMGAIKIVLFGSLVNGEVDITSDLDLFILMPSARSGKEWKRLIYDKVEMNVASDIIVYNQKEFDEMLPGSSFLQNIMNTGRAIYEKTA